MKKQLVQLLLTENISGFIDLIEAITNWQLSSLLLFIIIYYYYYLLLARQKMCVSDSVTGLVEIIRMTSHDETGQARTDWTTDINVFIIITKINRK